MPHIESISQFLNNPNIEATEKIFLIHKKINIKTISGLIEK